MGGGYNCAGSMGESNLMFLLAIFNDLIEITTVSDGFFESFLFGHVSFNKPGSFRVRLYGNFYGFHFVAFRS
jgi:hypothetical protein